MVIWPANASVGEDNETTREGATKADEDGGAEKSTKTGEEKNYSDESDFGSSDDDY